MSRHFRATDSRSIKCSSPCEQHEYRVRIGNASDPRQQNSPPFAISLCIAYGRYEIAVANTMDETERHAAENGVEYTKLHRRSTESKQKSESQDMYITELVGLNTVAS